MKEIILLGATGSIGTQCLDVIRGNKFILKGFSFGNNINQAIKIIEEFHPLYVCCKEEKDKNWKTEKKDDDNKGKNDKYDILTRIKYQKEKNRK